MKSRLFFADVLPAVAMAIAVSVTACSAHPASDGAEAGDAGSGHVAKLDTCDPNPKVPSGVSPFCAEMMRRGEMLGVADKTCTSAAAHCTAYEPNLGDAYRSAYAQCSTTVPFCGGNEFQQCLVGAVPRITPTEAQKKVARDYCNTCNPDASDCATKFFATGDSPLPLGFRVLLASDTVAAAIDQACTGASLDASLDGGASDPACRGSFIVCAEKAARDARPPQACR